MRPHRNHKGYWAFLGHRLSGLGLALFLPFHFLALALVLDAARFNELITWTEHPLVKAAEWGLVFFLVLHLAFGLRLLTIEFTDWTGPDPGRARWIWPSVALSALAGCMFLVSAMM